MFEVIITTKWPILIPFLFNGKLVFASLELLKFHHSFLFLSNILILFQSLICIKYFRVCFNVCPMKSLLCFLRCPLVFITLIRWVMFTYLKLWRLRCVDIRAGKIQFFDTQKSLLLRTGSGECCAPCNFLFCVSCGAFFVNLENQSYKIENMPGAPFVFSPQCYFSCTVGTQQKHAANISSPTLFN